MKVRNVIDKGWRIKLGAANGSSFIFCGDAKKSTYLYLERMSEKYKNVHEKLLERLEDDADWVEIDIMYEDNEKENKKLRRQLARLKERIDDLKQYVKNYKPLEERDVVEIYDSIIEENTKIVLFDGIENGSFWTCGEYERNGGKIKC